MINNKKILAVIPARGGSKGIKLKNLKKINNKSLVSIAANFVKKCSFFDCSVISTDNDIIKKEAKKNKLTIIDRPKKLSGDKISDTSVLIHAVKKIERVLNSKFDVVVMLHPTSPLREKKDIKICVKRLIKKKLMSIWTISETDSKYHPHKQLILNKNKLSYFSNKGNKVVYRQQLNKIYHRNSAAYVINRNFLLKQKKLIGIKTEGHVIRKQQISIDNYEDLIKARKLFKN